MPLRYGRNYKLTINLSNTEAVEITPELRIIFSIEKKIPDIKKGKTTTPSIASIAIYNLEPTKRNKLFKDDERTDDQKTKGTFIEDYFKVNLAIGYDEIQTIFQGNVIEAGTERAGADFITKLSCGDGHYDFKNSFVSANVKGSQNDVVNKILETMTKTGKGAITPMEKEGIRGKILLGSSAKMLDEQVGYDKVWFIDNEKVNVLNEKNAIAGKIQVINSETGLLSTPTKKDKLVECTTLLNPYIKLGSIVKLESSQINRNGFYRVDRIKYYGDFIGNDWSQDLGLLKMNDYTEVK